MHRQPDDPGVEPGDEKRRERRFDWIGWAVFIGAILFLAGILWVAGTYRTLAHEAPSGKWVYPPGCCRSAEEPGGDCAPIDDRYVTTRADGFHVDLPKGAHPKLLTKGYAAVIPYSQARPSPDGQTHICLSTDGAMRYCFFRMPPGV